MRLAKAATKFDTLVASDAYGTDTFLCQLAPLELYKIEGTKIKVKQMSTAPDVVIPARGAIRIDGSVYLIGHGSSDYWNGTPIRTNYVTQGADGLAVITTIASELAGSSGVSAYASAEFSRYLPLSADSSKYPPQYEIFFAGNETVVADNIVKLNDVWFIVKESYQAASGILVALANALNEPVFESASFVTTTYDPVSDVRSTGSVGVKIMRVKWTEHYTYLSVGSETYERGDQQVFLPKTLTPKPSDAVALSDGSWRILAVLDEGDRWSCHVRRS